MDLEERKKSVGGSDIAAVMGLSRWQTPLGLWAEKTGKIPAFEGNEASELGTELEDFVAKKFAKKTDLRVKRDSRTFTHPEFPYMVAHIDRWIVGSDAILECKTCSAWKEKEWGGEEIPMEYVLQVNWYCGLLGKTSCWLAVLIGGQKFIHKEMKFNGELFDKQVAVAKQFWEEFVLKDMAPMAIAGDSETLVELFPTASEKMVSIEDITAQADLNVAIEHRLEIIREIAAAETEKDTIDAKLKQVIGENMGVQTNRFVLTWKNVKRTSADPDAMKKAGIFEQYSQTSVSRTIRVNAKKEVEK